MSVAIAGCPILSRSLRKGGNDAAPGQTVFVASVGNPAYDDPMAKAKKLELENPAPILHDEDEETLAAIDEGIRDAEAGRAVPAEKVRELLPQWTTDSRNTAVDWVKIAQEWAEAARAGVAAERKRLQEILAERQRKPTSEQPRLTPPRLIPTS
jgi:hypothetical protein